MSNNSKNFFVYPSKKIVIFFVALCFIGNVLLILAATDLFKEHIFQRKNIMIIGLMSSSILLTFKLYANYLKNKYSKKNNFE